jgi:hypothetical protein
MSLTVTPANVAPLVGSVVRNGILNAEAALGSGVYPLSTGKLAKSQANTAAASLAIGVLVSANEAGATTAPADKSVAIVTFGPVAGFTGMTPGGLVYVDASTAGAFTQTKPSGASTWTHAIGYALEEDILFVMPGIASPVSNS